MQDVKLSFPLARSAGNLYFAGNQFPHSKTWVGQAAGQVNLKMDKAQLLGLAFSYDFNDKETAKVQESIDQLTSADYSMCSFNTGVLKAVTKSQLIEMRLDFATVGQADLDIVGNLSTIETLWLTGSSIRDEQLDKLAKLPKLTTLALKSTAISEHGLKHLKQFKTLQRLHLPSTISDPAVAVLTDVLPQVEELDLSFSKITDNATADLAKLPKLTTLYLNDTEITDAALAPLAQSKSINVLFLNGTKVTDNGIAALSDLTTLEHLELRDTRVTEMGAQRLKSKLKDCAVFGP